MGDTDGIVVFKTDAVDVKSLTKRLVAVWIYVGSTTWESVDTIRVSVTGANKTEDVIAKGALTDTAFFMPGSPKLAEGKWVQEQKNLTNVKHNATFVLAWRADKEAEGGRVPPVFCIGIKI